MIIVIMQLRVLEFFCYTKLLILPKYGQVEGILNGIVSMLALVEGERREDIILSFCEKLNKAPNNQLGLVCLKVSVYCCLPIHNTCLRVPHGG